VKDESAYLQAVQEPEASQQAESEASPVVAHLPLYRHGTRVTYQGRYYTVGHVVISRTQLLVHLQELGAPVNAEKLQVAPTRILLQRS